MRDPMGDGKRRKEKSIDEEIAESHYADEKAESRHYFGVDLASGSDFSVRPDGSVVH